ncbi:hypothetical protein [Chitinophaga sp. LS1]|uniref:hypothetical protein n=1 Tax=Chitinophaga sp. LS1 TaxID=3051176 RepID=UPI002AAB4B5B|nr:hypothetical protein [Chitinophaga sp. LS1]WPV67785.1 hypothetical protein QQL36_03465 [Chitinophaga sp. LS1]
MHPEQIIYQDINQLFPAEAGSPNIQQIEKIITKKVEELTIGQGPWQLFHDAIKNEHGNNAFDTSASPFPAYNSRILLADEKEEHYVVKRYLCIDVSLITPFYTIYFEDFYSFNRYRHEDVPGGKLLVHQHVLFFKSMTNESFKESAERANNYVRQFFPEYQFVSHYALFNYKVDNLLPYTINEMDRAKAYSLHDFVMSSYYYFKKVNVII